MIRQSIKACSRERKAEVDGERHKPQLTSTNLTRNLHLRKLENSAVNKSFNVKTERRLLQKSFHTVMISGPDLNTV